MQPRTLLQSLLFLALSLCALAPALPQLNSAIPTPVHGSRTVPLFNTWTILWNSLQLHNGFPNYWHAPIFFPADHTFAFSEPQPATLLLAPLKPHASNPALAYNAWLILSLTLNGVFAARILRWLDIPIIFNSAASAAVVLHPLVHHQLDSAQLAPLWPSIWTTTAILQLSHLASSTPPCRRRVVFKGLESGLALCATAACALHHALFLALLLLLTCPLAIPFRNLRNWLPGAIAASVALLPLLPAALLIHNALDAPHYIREQALINQLSVQPADFIRSPPGAILQLPQLIGKSFFPINPGWLRLLACTTAALTAAASLFPRTASQSLSSKQAYALRFLAALTLAAALLALGSRLQLGPLNLWSALAHYIPGFAQVRSPFRFAYFYQTYLLLLAAPGLSLLHHKLTQSNLFKLNLRSQFITALLAAIALTCETLPHKLQLVGVPNPAQIPPWITAVRQHLPNGHGLLILPLPPDASAAAYEDTNRRMIHATVNNVPLVNGYSGFFPPAHYELQQQLRNPPTPQLTQKLLNQNISAILSTSEITTRQLLNASPNSLAIRWQHPPSQTTLFQIQPATN